MMLDVVNRFAKSLDAEDYVTASACLAADCEYTCRGERFRGRSAIIQAYRGNGDSAASAFDSVTYESAVSRLTANTAKIHFTDHLQHNAKQLTFACEQLVEVDEDQQIVRIEHTDLHGHLDALNSFKRQASVR